MTILVLSHVNQLLLDFYNYVFTAQISVQYRTQTEHIAHTQQT